MGCRQEYCLENMLVEKIMREHKLVQQVAAEEQLQIFSEPELVPSKYHLHDALSASRSTSKLHVSKQTIENHLPLLCLCRAALCSPFALTSLISLSPVR